MGETPVLFRRSVESFKMLVVYDVLGLEGRKTGNTSEYDSCHVSGSTQSRPINGKSSHQETGTP
jgi:hypothetical protein